MIQHIQNKDRLEYSLAIRNLFIVDNQIGYVDIIKNGTPIPVLRREIGSRNLAKVLGMMLANFVSAFNVSKNMNDDQITDYAVTLMEESMYGSYEDPVYRLEDFATFFEIAKTGRFGRPFDYIDSSLIEKWLNEYHKRRTCEHVNEINKLPEYEAPETPASPQFIRETFEALTQKLTAPELPPTKEELAEMEARKQRMIDNRRREYNEG